MSRYITSAIIPRALLLAGLACAVVLVSRNIVEVNSARAALAAAKRNYRLEAIAYERCAADVKKSGSYGDVLDMVVEARCPLKPLYDPEVSFAQYEKTSRATALGLAGVVTVLASLPWLARRWTRARVRPPIRA